MRRHGRATTAGATAGLRPANTRARRHSAEPAARRSEWWRRASLVSTLAIAALVTFFWANLSAQTTVGAPVVLQPAIVPAGSTTEILVTSTIVTGPSDPPVLATGVNLLRVDATDRVLATLGVMRDDGQAGDATAGDGVFTLRVAVAVASVDSLRLRVSAAFLKVIQRKLSTVTNVPVQAADTTPPTLTITAPPSGAPISQNPPTLQVTYADAGSGVDPDTLAWQANGAPLAASCTTTPTGATCTSSGQLPVGGVTLRASISDRAGNLATAESSITVPDAPAPGGLTLSITSPGSGAVLAASPVTVRGAVGDPYARVTVQGVLASAAAGTYELPNVRLVEGTNRIAAAARAPDGRQATAEAIVTLDTIAPWVRVSTPTDRALVHDATVTLTGTVIDASAVTCTVNGATAALTQSAEAWAGALAIQSGAIALTPGPNTIAVTCRDAAGHESSQAVTVFHATEPTTVTSVTPAHETTGVATTSAVQVTFSGPIDPASARDTTVYLRDDLALVPAAISVSPDGRLATVTPFAPLSSGRTIAVIVTRGVGDTRGNPLAAAHISTFTTEGERKAPGDIIGEVYDDTRSLPLADVTVEVFDETGAQVLAAVTDARGRYVLSPGRVDLIVRLSKPGFTTVERVLSTEQGTFAEVLDARLTPLASPRVLPPAGGTADVPSGEQLVIPNGALTAPTSITFTRISPQGPRRTFPLGWSPLSIVDVRGLDAIAAPATLRIGGRVEGVSGRTALVARFDETSGDWLAVDAATLSESGIADVSLSDATGQFALLVPDADPAGPAMPAVGNALPAADEIAIPIDAMATGIVVPPVGRADDPSAALATVTIVGDVPLRSGSLLRGDFVEVVLLRDGSRAAPPQTGQDLLAYCTPADGACKTLVAPFAIAASRTFALMDVLDGAVTVDLTRGATRARTLLGTGGGGVASLDGVRLGVPVDAFGAAVPVSVRRLAEFAFPIQTPQGLAFIGGVDVDLFGASATAPLHLTLEGGAAGAPTGSSVIVAELRTVRGVERLVPVAMGRVEGDALTTVTSLGGVQLPGVRTGGRYAFYAIDGEVAAVPGTARDAAGRHDGHSIELAALPFVSVTDGSGTFTLVSRPGTFDLVATAVTTLDRARVSGQTGTPLAAIVIGPTPPRLESILVRPARVDGLIAGPVTLLGRPAPVVDDDNAGGTQGNGNGTIEAGERVALTLAVRNDGTASFFGGAFALRVRGTETTVDVTPETMSVPELAPDVATTLGPFVFTVPAGVDPTALRFSLYHLADGQVVSNEIAFALPLGVEHPNVHPSSEITLRFSEPVVKTSLETGIALVREENGGDVPVSFRVVPDSTGTVASVRPNERLADGVVFRLTLAPSIVDADSRALVGAPIVERISTPSRTAPAPIDPGRITTSMPDAAGQVTVSATAGSVNPDDTVMLLNDVTGGTVLVTVNSDGSFTARIHASLSDRLLILLRDRADNQTRVEVGPMLRRDPVTGEVLAAVVRQAGGSFTRDGIRLDVPVGAMPGGVELSVSRVTEPFTLPADIAADQAVAAAFAEKFRPVLRVRLEASVERFAGPVKLSVPAPAGASVGDLYLLVRTRPVTSGGVLADLDRMTGLTAADNPIRTVDRLEVIESATVKDDHGTLVLSTDSPPFNGALEPGVLTYLELRGDVTLVHGTVRRDTATGRVVEGAVVQGLPAALATVPFAAITNPDGEFVVPDAAAGGPHLLGAMVSSRLDVFDDQSQRVTAGERYRRVIRRGIRATVGPPPGFDVTRARLEEPLEVAVADLEEPFVLPDRLPREIYEELGDIDPPTVTMQIEGPDLNGALAKINSPLTVTVVANDNVEATLVSLEVNRGAGFVAVPLDGERRADVVPFQDGLLTFRATARDDAGNVAITDVSVRVTPKPDETTSITPLEGTKPTVVEPPLGNRTCTFDGECLPRFSEPLDPNTVNVNSVQMFDPDGKPVAIKVTLDAGDPTLVRIAPKRNLRFGTTYQIQIGSTIRDLNGESPAVTVIICPVPMPVQLTTIPLPNAQDIGLIGDDYLVAINNPQVPPGTDTTWNATLPGQIHAFRLRGEDGEMLEAPVRVSSTTTLGMPYSLAVDGNRVYVSNRYLGTPASASILAASFLNPFTMLGTLGGLGGMLSTWTSLPTIPSNLQVFDFTDPGKPTSIGARPLNHLGTLDDTTGNMLTVGGAGLAPVFEQPPTLWNPNAFPTQTVRVGNRVAVVNAFNNIEFFDDADRPNSLGVIERVDGPMMFPGRCAAGPYDDAACTVGHLDPLGQVGRAQCGGAQCRPHYEEFLHAAFFDDFAVTLEKEGVRVVSTAPEHIGTGLYNNRTLSRLPLSGAEIGRTAAVSGFKWEDESGEKHTTDLAFVSTANNRFTVLDVTNPNAPTQIASVPAALGPLAVDACSGTAYIHGSGGTLYAIDINDPYHPVDLNLPYGAPPFRLGGLGSPAALSGSLAESGSAYVVGSSGIGYVDLRLASAMSRAALLPLAAGPPLYMAGGAAFVAMLAQPQSVAPPTIYAKYERGTLWARAEHIRMNALGLHLSGKWALPLVAPPFDPSGTKKQGDYFVLPYHMETPGGELVDGMDLQVRVGVGCATLPGRWTLVSAPRQYGDIAALQSRMISQVSDTEAIVKGFEHGGVYRLAFRRDACHSDECDYTLNIVLPLAGADVTERVLADLEPAARWAAAARPSIKQLCSNAKDFLDSLGCVSSGVRRLYGWFYAAGNGDYVGRPDTLADVRSQTARAYNGIDDVSDRSAGLGAVVTWYGVPVRMSKVSNMVVGYALGKLGLDDDVLSCFAQLLGTVNAPALMSCISGEHGADSGVMSFFMGADLARGVLPMERLPVRVAELNRLIVLSEADDKVWPLWPNTYPPDNYREPAVCCWAPSGPASWNDYFTSPGFLIVSVP